MAAGETVTIACKHPNGLVLNLDRYVRLTDQGQQVRREVGRMTVKLAGWAHEFNVPDPAAATGGYVLTQVPADFWEQWLAEHKDFPMIADKTILGPGIEAGMSPRAQGDIAGKARAHLDVPKMHAPSSGDLKALQAAELKKD